MNKMKKKAIIGFRKGWTLVELCAALIILAILIGLSVQAIKPRKLLIAPFAYAGVQNLRQANNYIFNKCKNGQVIGCPTDGTSLPVMSDEVLTNYVKWYCDSNPDKLSESVLNDYCTGTHNAGEAYEPYCYEVAEIFTLIDNEIQCKNPTGSVASSVRTKLPKGNGKGANAGLPNFQAANMVSYYFLETTWRTINRAAPVETDMTAVTPTQYKEIFIDVNGNKEPNKLGEDQFPLRLYVTGEVIPSICDYFDGERDGVEAGSAYVSFCPTTPGVNTMEWITTNYPLAYNVYRSYVSDPNEPEKRTTERILSGVSYKEAACRAGRDNLIPREALCGNGDNGTIKSTSLTDNTFHVYERCTSEYKPAGTDAIQHSFCIVRLAKPSNPGLFRLPIAL